MAELDTIEIINPLDTEYVVRFNGEPYKLAAGEKKFFPRFLAIHIAKHLSEKILSDKKDALRKKFGKDNPYIPQLSTLFNHDNTERRIALYRVLGDKDLVQSAVIASNLKGFVGEMKEYEDFLEKVATGVATQEEPKKGRKKVQE